MTTIINKPTESLHARIAQGTLNELDSIASVMCRSRNWIFNEALKQFLDVQRWQTDLVKKRLNESNSLEAHFIPQQKIMRKYKKHLKAKLGL
jgi:predicted transcriptional regulator